MGKRHSENCQLGMIFIYTLILSQVFLTWAVDIHWENSFYIKPLTNQKNCKAFFNSWYRFARCDLYIDEFRAKLFLDPLSERSLKNCLSHATDAQQKKLLLTDFRGVTSISPLLEANYSSLKLDKEMSVHLIPLYRVFMGPGGNWSEIIREPPDSFRNTLIVLAPTEEENIRARYPGNFEKLLDQSVLNFSMFRDTTRMIQLNAWHLINMRKMFTWHGLKYFMGIILYATPKHARFLSISKLKSRIPVEYHDRVYLDIYQIQETDYVMHKAPLVSNKLNQTRSSSSGTVKSWFVIVNLLIPVIVYL